VKGTDTVFPVGTVNIQMAPDEWTKKEMRTRQRARGIVALAAALDSCRRRSSTPSAAWAVIVRTGIANLQAWSCRHRRPLLGSLDEIQIAGQRFAKDRIRWIYLRR
jgi:hypothetical protein